MNADKPGNRARFALCPETATATGADNPGNGSAAAGVHEDNNR